MRLGFYMQIYMDIVLKLLLVFTFFFSKIRSQAQQEVYGGDVEDLISETKFRSMKLQWHYDSPIEPVGFFVTLCEVTPWQRSQDDCFERHLLLGKRNVLAGYDSIITDGKGHYQAVLYGLRMLTNYTVSVHAMDDQNRLRPADTSLRRAKLRFSDTILVATKGFSAHATNCHANSSDIVVHTGPYFGGKITVEGSSDERCSVYGNRSSHKDTYTLKIDHKLCGSKTVNDTRIDTIVIVHESSSVVTHNSRKFLVQCNFLPETFTIKAAFNIPQDTEEKKNFNYRQLEEALKNFDSNDIYTYDHFKENHVKDSRMSSEQAHSVLQGGFPGYESHMLSLLVVIIVLIIVIVVVIGFSLWCYIHANRRRSNSADIETMSTSGSSFMAYQVGGDNDALVRPASTENALAAPFHDGICSQTFPRAVNPFYGNQVALVSLKPVKELY